MLMILTILIYFILLEYELVIIACLSIYQSLKSFRIIICSKLNEFYDLLAGE